RGDPGQGQARQSLRGGPDEGRSSPGQPRPVLVDPHQGRAEGPLSGGVRTPRPTHQAKPPVTPARQHQAIDRRKIMRQARSKTGAAHATGPMGSPRPRGFSTPVASLIFNEPRGDAPPEGRTLRGTRRTSGFSARAKVLYSLPDGTYGEERT